MSALLYLMLASAGNRLREALIRLREPKYLVGVGAAVAYFWFFVFGPLSKAGGASNLQMEEMLADGRSLMTGVAALVLLLALLFSWMMPNKRAALRFTETEINVLFAAPIEHRTLVHFKLLKLQAGTLITVAIFTFLSATFKPGVVVPGVAIGWWLLLTLVQLHALGSAFARERLLEGGSTGNTRRWLLLGLFAACVLGSFAWVWAGLAGVSSGSGPLGWLDAVKAAVRTGPLGWLLTPFTWLVQPLFARTSGQFWLSVLPLAGVVVLHYFWVVRSASDFSEASVAASEKFARQRERMVLNASRGLPFNLRARPDAWKLASAGRPELGLAWKNLTLLGVWGRPARLGAAVLVSGVLGLLAGFYAPFTVQLMAGSIAGTLLVFLLLSGGQMVRFDLRQDARHMDVLKTLPLDGAALVRGEIIAPVVLLTAWQYGLGLFLLCLMLADDGGRDKVLGGLWAVGVLTAVIAPLLNTLNLLLANALFLLFPAWYQVDANNAQGIHRMGQGIVQMLFQSMLMLVVVIPAGLCLAVFAYAGFSLADSGWGALAGIPPAALLLWAAVRFFSEAVGRDVESFDLARELR